MCRTVLLFIFCVLGMVLINDTAALLVSLNKLWSGDSPVANFCRCVVAAAVVYGLVVAIPWLYHLDARFHLSDLARSAGL